MATEERARNWFFVTGITATAILMRSTTMTIATTGHALSITEPATATATLAVTIAANASSVIVESAARKTVRRRNFLKLSAEEKDRYMRYINESKYTTSDYVVTTKFYDEISDAIKAEEDPSRLFHNISHFDFFTWTHYYSARETIYPRNVTKSNIDFGHKGQGFLIWHRLYLLAWERTLQVSAFDKSNALVQRY